MDNILNTILQNTYTLSQLRHRLRALKTYLEDKFFGGVGSQSSPEIDTAWINSLPSSFLQNFNSDNLRIIFQDLQKQILNLQALTVYLAFDPDNETISQIGQMVRQKFTTPLILDVKYDSNLIAGSSLVWKGIYKDYSLRSKIEARKGEISESFKKFLR